jgi:hypothetical protein
MFRASVVPTKKRRETTPTCFQAGSAAEAAIYGEVPQASTAFFAILLQFAARTPQRTAGTPIKIGVRRPGSRPQAAESTALSGALDIFAHGFGLGLDALHPMLDQIADRDDPAEPAAVCDR